MTNLNIIALCAIGFVIVLLLSVTYDYYRTVEANKEMLEILRELNNQHGL